MVEERICIRGVYWSTHRGPRPKMKADYPRKKYRRYPPQKPIKDDETKKPYGVVSRWFVNGKPLKRI